MIHSFLPYTIHFTLPTPARRQSPVRRLSSSAGGGNKSESLSLFKSYRDQDRTQTTPPATPRQATGHEGLFAQGRPSTAPSGPTRPHDPLSLPLSDPHSPEWGSGHNFNQPRSRALSPPPASLLKHARGHGRFTHNARADARKAKGKSRSPDPEYDSVFASAPWTIEQADQSNGGLQKAVAAACKAGTLKEKTWVSLMLLSLQTYVDDLFRWALWGCR